MLPPEERPSHLPFSAKWLSGEGAGSWFVIERTGNPLQYKITRFSPGGMIECEGLFQSDKIVYLDKQYELTYPAHCSRVTIIQEGTKIHLTLLNSPSMNIYKPLIAVILLVALNNKTMAQEKRSAQEAKGLSVGTKAPLFEALTQDSTNYALADSLKKGPVVLIFYRGQWCPICNRHLSNIQDSLKLIYEKGATVIAVSPEKPELLNKTAEKTGAKFTLLYDEGYKICDAYDVTFTPNGATRLKYNTFLGADLKNAHSDDSERLPIPATYVINKEGVIVWRQFDPDYRNRSTVKDILKHL